MRTPLQRKLWKNATFCHFVNILLTNFTKNVGFFFFRLQLLMSDIFSRPILSDIPRCRWQKEKWLNLENIDGGGLANHLPVSYECTFCFLRLLFTRLTDKSKDVHGPKELLALLVSFPHFCFSWKVQVRLHFSRAFWRNLLPSRLPLSDVINGVSVSVCTWQCSDRHRDSVWCQLLVVPTGLVTKQDYEVWPVTCCV